MNDPIINNAIDLETGSSVRLELTLPEEATDLVIRYRLIGDRVWTDQTIEVTDTVDCTGLTEDRKHEFVAIAVDVFGDYSLPSIPVRITPTSGEGPISRRIEKDIIETLENVTSDEGFFDTVDQVYRFSFPINKGDDDFFIALGFTSIGREDAVLIGDRIDLRPFDMYVVAGRTGRDGSSDWIPDSIHNMMNAIQSALAEDPERNGLALDTIPGPVITDPDDLGELTKVADAMVALRFTINFRTYRTDPSALG